MCAPGRRPVAARRTVAGGGRNRIDCGKVDKVAGFANPTRSNDDPSLAGSRRTRGRAIKKVLRDYRFVPGAMRDRPARLTAIVEADETFRLESQKGSRRLNRNPRKRAGVAKRRGINREHDCLLVARDRTGQTIDFHTGRGQVTAE